MATISQNVNQPGRTLELTEETTIGPNVRYLIYGEITFGPLTAGNRFHLLLQSPCLLLKAPKMTGRGVVTWDGYQVNPNPAQPTRAESGTTGGDGVPGQPAGIGLQRDGAPGGRGGNGVIGADGIDGQDGPRLLLAYVDYDSTGVPPVLTLLSSAELEIYLAGQPGGPGQHGGHGGDGGRGGAGADSTTGRWNLGYELKAGRGGKGGSGGDGAMGGNGGRGGAGGLVQVLRVPHALWEPDPKLPPKETTVSVHARLQGGVPGTAGQSGFAGQGGTPGIGGRGETGTPSTDRLEEGAGAPGNPGRAGATGRQVVFGLSGQVEVQTIRMDRFNSFTP